jgi:hypothetical protein
LQRQPSNASNTSSSKNMASTAHGRSWSQLPAEIMQQIVLLLLLHDRLASCALISTAWAAAVAAAPVSCVDLIQTDVASLEQIWQRCLAKLDCQQLTSVRLGVDDPFHLHHRALVKGLPAGLQALDLSGLSLGLNASAEQLQSARRLLSSHGHSSSDTGGTSADEAVQAAHVEHGLPVDALASLTRLQLEHMRLHKDRLAPGRHSSIHAAFRLAPPPHAQGW